MIPYVDFKAQHERLRDELTHAFHRVLAHSLFILGPEVGELEERLAERIGVRHVVGVGNGTDALVLALRAHGIGHGDEVITVSHTYFATVGAVAMVGATPVMVDIDDETTLIDPSAVEEAITDKTRAILPVHLGGHACDMTKLGALCARHGLILIEDAAQSIGASFMKRPVGSFGTGCFSLHPLKVLGALGDAGFISTDDDELASELKLLRTIGHKDRDHVVRIAGNSRLDTLQAALLLVKERHLDDWIAARRAHAAAYEAAFNGRVRMVQPNDAGSVHSTFVIRHVQRDALLKALHARGIEAKIHYPIPCHRQAAFAHLPVGPLTVTERVAGEIISLPVSPELSVEQRNIVIGAVLDSVGPLQ